MIVTQIRIGQGAGGVNFGEPWADVAKGASDVVHYDDGDVSIHLSNGLNLFAAAWASGRISGIELEAPSGATLEGVKVFELDFDGVARFLTDRFPRTQILTRDETLSDGIQVEAPALGLTFFFEERHLVSVYCAPLISPDDDIQWPRI